MLSKNLPNIIGDGNYYSKCNFNNSPYGNYIFEAYCCNFVEKF